MHFSEDTPTGSYIINAYSANSITINKREYNNSIYVSPTKLIDDIPLRSCEQLSLDSLQFVFDLKPELFILGTGSNLLFPSANIIATLATHKIGFEAMDHSAACRTFAILAAEQRNVGALLLIDHTN